MDGQSSSKSIHTAVQSVHLSASASISETWPSHIWGTWNMRKNRRHFLHTFYSTHFFPMPWVNKTHITKTLCRISVAVLGASSAKATCRPCPHHNIISIRLCRWLYFGSTEELCSSVYSRHCGVDFFLLYNKSVQFLITGYHMGHRLLNNYCVIKYNLTLFYYYVNISVALEVNCII